MFPEPLKSSLVAKSGGLIRSGVRTLLCQVCGIEAPTRNVMFHQAVGAIFAYQTNSVKGNLCKTCIEHYFWDYSSSTALFGWWGVLTVFLAPFILISNVREYRRCRAMEYPSPEASKPVLTEDVVDRLREYAFRLIDRLNLGEDTQKVVVETAQAAKVSPGQVVLFIREMLPSQAQTGGLAPSSDDQL